MGRQLSRRVIEQLRREREDVMSPGESEPPHSPTEAALLAEAAQMRDKYRQPVRDGSAGPPDPLFPPAPTPVAPQGEPQNEYPAVVTPPRSRSWTNTPVGWPMAVVVAIAAAIFLGNYHVVSSSQGTNLVPKGHFTFSETFVSLYAITEMPWIAAKSRWPLACKDLQKAGLLESDEAFEERVQRDVRDKLQKEFGVTLPSATGAVSAPLPGPSGPRPVTPLVDLSLTFEAAEAAIQPSPSTTEAQLDEAKRGLVGRRVRWAGLVCEVKPPEQPGCMVSMHCSEPPPLLPELPPPPGMQPLPPFPLSPEVVFYLPQSAALPLQVRQHLTVEGTIVSSSSGYFTLDDAQIVG